MEARTTEDEVQASPPSLLAPSGVNGSGETDCVSPAVSILQSSNWKRENP